MNGHKIRKYIPILVSLLVSAAAYAATAEDFPFVYITSDSVRTAPVFSDQQFYEISTKVIFKVNRTEINPDDEFFEKYRNEILPLVNSKHLQLRKIYIRGAASPEGPYPNNVRLSRGRSAALLEALRKDLRFQYLDPEVDVCNITEDYRFLILLMEMAGDPESARVKRIYDHFRGDEHAVKQQLKKEKGGVLWYELYDKYFAQLRAARVILWFSEPDEQHAPLPEGKPITTRLLPPPAPLAQPSPWTPEPVQEPQYTRRHLIALRTNLIHDFFYMPNFGFAPSPNIQLEYYPLDGHWTANAGMTWGTRRKWNSQQFWQVRDFQLEARRYFKGHGEFTGFYLGAFLHGDVYGIGLSQKKGWQGEGAGAGISAGYVLPLNRKGNFRMEFMVGLGAFVSVFDPYVYGNPLTSEKDGFYYYDYLGSATDFKRRNHLFTWFGPTNVGIQLTYDIIYRKKKLVE